jgi:hypothetical protein
LVTLTIVVAVWLALLIVAGLVTLTIVVAVLALHIVVAVDIDVAVVHRRDILDLNFVLSIVDLILVNLIIVDLIVNLVSIVDLILFNLRHPHRHVGHGRPKICYAGGILLLVCGYA